MTDKRSGLQIEQRVNTTAPLGQEIPPITESNLVVTAVIVILAFILLGPIALISIIFLVLAFLKLKDKEYEKAISFNRIARISGIILLVAGIIAVVIPIVIVIIFYAIVIPIRITQR